VQVSLACVVLGACSAATYDRRAEDAANRLLHAEFEFAEQQRRESLVYPEQAAAPEPAAPGEESGDPIASSSAAEGEDLGQLTLPEAIELAIQGNRGYKSQVESLHLQASSLVGTRHSFTPLLSATLSYAFSDSVGSGNSSSSSLSGGLSQILRFGGNLSVSGSSSWSATNDDGLGGDIANSVGVSLSQPLLDGFGEEVTMEPLVQAERNLLYAIRDFEQFREDFSVDVADTYYGLAAQKKGIDNARRNLEGLEFARRKAEAFFDVGRVAETEALRARRSELDARDALNASIESYELALDRFKIFLGLPTSTRIDVIEEVPAFVEMTYDIDSAVQVALHNRLDVISERERLEDSERGFRFSKQALLPNLDLNLSWNAALDGLTDPANFETENESYSASISLDLPIDYVDEQIAYHSARIGLQRARRSHEEFLDNVVINVKSAFRGLERSKQSIDIQREQVRNSARFVRKAEIEFERGNSSNRDVVEAKEQQLAAENALIQNQVDYEIARLRLLRDLGILFIDENGLFRE
jgi:outer membrane protein TolC